MRVTDSADNRHMVALNMQSQELGYSRSIIAEQGPVRGTTERSRQVASKVNSTGTQEVSDAGAQVASNISAPQAVQLGAEAQARLQNRIERNQRELEKAEEKLRDVESKAKFDKERRVAGAKKKIEQIQSKITKDQGRINRLRETPLDQTGQFLQQFVKDRKGRTIPVFGSKFSSFEAPPIRGIDKVGNDGLGNGGASIFGLGKNTGRFQFESATFGDQDPATIARNQNRLFASTGFGLGFGLPGGFTGFGIQKGYTTGVGQSALDPSIDPSQVKKIIVVGGQSVVELKGDRSGPTQPISDAQSLTDKDIDTLFPPEGPSAKYTGPLATSEPLGFVYSGGIPKDQSFKDSLKEQRSSAQTRERVIKTLTPDNPLGRLGPTQTRAPKERGPARHAPLSTFFMPEAARARYRQGSEGTWEGPLVGRTDAQWAMGPVDPTQGAQWVGRIRFVNTDAKMIPWKKQELDPYSDVLIGGLFKGEMWPDSSIANLGDNLGEETAQWVPVIRVDFALPFRDRPPEEQVESGPADARRAAVVASGPGPDPDPELEDIPDPHPDPEEPPFRKPRTKTPINEVIDFIQSNGQPIVASVLPEPFAPSEPAGMFRPSFVQQFAGAAAPAAGYSSGQRTGGGGGVSEQSHGRTPEGGDRGDPAGGAENPSSQDGDTGIAAAVPCSATGNIAGGDFSTKDTGFNSKVPGGLSPSGVGSGAGGVSVPPYLQTNDDKIFGHPAVRRDADGNWQIFMNSGESYRIPGASNEPTSYGVGEYNMANLPAPIAGDRHGPATAEASLRFTQIQFGCLQKSFNALAGGGGHLEASITAVNRNRAGPASGHHLGTHHVSREGQELQYGRRQGTSLTLHSILEAEGGSSVHAQIGGVAQITREHRGDGNVIDDRPLLLLENDRGTKTTGPGNRGDLIAEVDRKFFVDKNSCLEAQAVATCSTVDFEPSVKPKSSRNRLFVSDGNDADGLVEKGLYYQQQDSDTPIRVDSSGDGFEIGMTSWFPHSAALPSGWAQMDASAVSRTTYAEAFSKLGTDWGVGDGSTTFNLPESRGHTLGGSGTGPGLTARSVGDMVGAEDHTIAEGEMPSHNHGINDSGHTHTINDSGHTHTVNDTGHTHTVNDTGHTHSQNTLGGGANANTAAGLGDVRTGSTASSSTTSATTGITNQSATTGVTNQSATTGVTAASATTGITTNSAGSGTAMDIMNPTAYGVWAIKLL